MMKSALLRAVQLAKSVTMCAKIEKVPFYALHLSVAVIAIFSPSNSVAQSLVTNPLDKKLKPYADRYNAGLPTMVAATLRQERITVFNGVISYRYTDVSRTGAELAPLNLEVTQRPYIFPAICKAPDTGRMLRDGVTFRYLYYGNDGKLAAQLIFLPADCATAR